MDVSIWAVILLLVAVLLLFAEVLIPSGGIIFAVSMCCLCLSVISAWNAWWDRYPILWWTFVLSVIVLLPSAVGAAIYVWPHTPIGKMMEPPTTEEVTPYAAEQRRLEKLVGKTGETLTPQNPAGISRIDGQRIHSLSEGMIIAHGVPVRVVGVRGNSVIVRCVEPGDDLEQTESSGSASAEAERDSGFDFELPQA